MAEETLIQRLYRQAGQAVADSADAVGTYVAKRLDTQLYPDDMREFQTAPPSEYAQFLEAAWQAMEMPVVKIGDQAIVSITPIQCSYLDAGTQKLLPDFGVMVIYRG